MPTWPTLTDIVPPAGVLPGHAWAEPEAEDPDVVDLTGPWRFRLTPTAAGLPAADAGADWPTIRVPAHWQLEGHGSPAYTNVIYPIPVDPPRVPAANPTGEYRREIEVPAAWLAEGRVVLRFEGVDSWFSVHVGGVQVATSSGSRLPTEVDVTDAVRPGANLLAVRVHQWSAMTYVEDQDQWWMSGIFRPVRLIHRRPGAVTDWRVRADYDHAAGTGTLAVEVPGCPDARVVVAELGIDVPAGAAVTVPVEPWSAEHPRLYDLEIRTAAATRRLRTGFRTVDVRDGVLRVNGAPVVLRGVNRHEFEPRTGRAVSPEVMLQDVLLMKQHHVNAVRTSHYPPDPRFLDLCDEHGLYVVDENDLETHGFELLGWRQNPTDDEQWRDVLVDRVTRMVRRDAHHPAIVLWSLGNEAGTGRNVGAMADAVRALDASRPVHYEPDLDGAHVDVYSRMYASPEEVELIGQGLEDPLPDAAADARRRAMPFVLCEYAHAMGNGPGLLADYDRLFDTYPRVAGGFVWEWIDHGIATTDAGGREFYGYGGDFGERLHDGTFIADGLLLPDRTPSPGLVELAATFEPVRLEPTGDGVRVRNRWAFTSTAAVELGWVVEADGERVAAGVLDAPVVAAGGSVEVPRPGEVDRAVAGVPDGPAVWWTVTARPAVAGAGSGAVPATVGRAQQVLRAAAPLVARPGDPALVRSDAAGTTVGPVALRADGTPARLGGLTVTALRLDAWRAPTDNDRASNLGLVPDAELWERAGLDRLEQALRTVDVRHDAVTVAGRVAGAGTDCGFGVRYTWSAPDARTVDLEVEATPEGRWPGGVARLGLLLVLADPAAADAGVDWLGSGPGEAYEDSRRAVALGRWSATVADLQTRYTHPQENGARRDVRRAGLGLTGGRLVVEAGTSTLGGRTLDTVELSVRPWGDHALADAAHPHELAEDGNLWVHLDLAQHGLGTAACGPGVARPARLDATPAVIRLRFTTG